MSDHECVRFEDRHGEEQLLRLSWVCICVCVCRADFEMGVPFRASRAWIRSASKTRKKQQQQGQRFNKVHKEYVGGDDWAIQGRLTVDVCVALENSVQASYAACKPSCRGH